MIIETVKVLPSAAEQGEFVVINKDDFNPELHTLFEKDTGDTSMTKVELQAALDAQGIAYKPAMTKVELQALLTPAV